MTGRRRESSEPKVGVGDPVPATSDHLVGCGWAFEEGFVFGRGGVEFSGCRRTRQGAAVTLHPHAVQSCLTVTSHVVSRRSSHSRATRPSDEPKTPGPGRLTASFATRGPRVQIPSAPLIRLVFVDKMPEPDLGLRRGFLAEGATPRSTGVPQDQALDAHLSDDEGLRHAGVAQLATRPCVSPRRGARVLPVTGTVISDKISPIGASAYSPTEVGAAVVRIIHAPSHTMATPRMTPPVR